MTGAVTGEQRERRLNAALSSIPWSNVAIPSGLSLATFAAVLPWVHAFRIGGAVALLLLAAVLSVAVTATVAGRLRRPAGVSYGASAAGLVALLVAGTGLHVGSVLHALADVPDRLITETLPLNGPVSMLAPVIVLTWLCGATCAELVYRASRRSALGDVALVVPVVLFVFGYAVTASAPGRDRVAGGLLLVGLVFVALARHDLLGSSVVASAAPPDFGGFDPDDAAVSPPARRLLIEGSIAATVALAVVLTLIVAGTDVLSGKPATLNKAPPVAASVIDDPVGATSSMRDGDPSLHPFPVMRIVTDRPAPGYLSAALLDNFDGSQWTFNATFKPTGERIPTPPGGVPLIGGETVEASEAVESALPFALLPALDRPVSVRGSPAVVDASTGMILPVRPGRGSTFRVVSEVPAATLAGVPTADGIAVAAGTLPGTASPDLAIPPDSSTALETAIRFVGNVTGARPAPTVAFLQRMLLAVHTQERRLSPYAPVSPTGSQPGQSSTSVPVSSSTVAGSNAGHLEGTSLSEVINAVTINRTATPEQFATFMALVARDLGVPARIATGFRVASGSARETVPAGAYQVDNRQAWTWVEIPVSGMGWVAADPTPDAVTGVAAPPPEEAQATPTTVPNKAIAVPKNATTGGHAIAKPARIHIHSGSGFPAWLISLIAAGAAVVVLLVGGPGQSGIRRRLRRRARHSTDPTLLAAGAWLELLDGLDRAGMQVPRSSTSAEIATEAAAHFGAVIRQQVAEVAEVADRSLYSTQNPPPFDDAVRVWSAQRDLTREILDGLDRRQRARALMAVGSSPRRPDR